MNFIRLPSLKLSNRDDEATMPHEEVPNSDRLADKTNPGDLFFPLTWKHNHHQPPQSDIYPEMQMNTRDHQSYPSPLGLRIDPYPHQSYAQEMFSFETPPAQHRSSPSGRRRRRTPHSYASMIAQAILTSKDQKMSLRDIYTWVQQRYPHLYETNETGWQNTIRHNLSLNRCFYKLPKSTEEKGRGKGKGGYWAVSLSQLNSTTFGRHLLDSGIVAGMEYWNGDDSSSTGTGDTQEGFAGTDMLQAAPMATLQQHQIHLHRRNPDRQSSLTHNPTFHPPSLQHILN
jgi:hypothetical protein